MIPKIKSLATIAIAFLALTVETPAPAGTATLDQSLTEHQYQLLAIAQDAAVAIPLQPHIKTRGRQQEKVADAAIQLFQPSLAYEYAQSNPNWRKGATLADLAAFYAQTGQEARAHELIEKALEIAKDAESWRRDTIRVKVARAHTILGELAEAEKNQANLESGSEFLDATVEIARAEFDDGQSYSEQVVTFDKMLATNDFEITKRALEGYATMYARYYSDQERREEIESKIKSKWSPSPIFVRFQVMKDLTQAAVDHGDHEKAQSLALEVQNFVDEYNWPLEHKVQFGAEAIQLIALSGQKDLALQKASELRQMYDEKKSGIMSMFRAESIRPLAEAYALMGEIDQAREVYMLALEDGAENANARPRAEDLTETLCSMAIHNVEPTEELWEKIKAIRGGLNNPW